MKSHERFERAMYHAPVGRPPIDIGGTSLTGMRPLCQRRLREYLGFGDPASATTQGIDERVLEWAGTDFRSVGGIVDLPSIHTKRVSDACHVDCWGVRREIANGEWQITESPLRGATVEDLTSFPWPRAHVDEQLLVAWEKQAAVLHREGTFAVVGEHPVLGILELGCWMCGYDDFLLRLAAEPDFVRRFFDKVLSIQLGVIEQYYGALGPYLHLTTSGDDFGTQAGPFMSPAMFEDLVMPYFSERIRRTKDIAECYYWHHSCGSVFNLIDGLIACGVDILNPVQTSALNMAPERLKSAYGDRIVFWGAVDVQQFLRNATPEEVERGIVDLVNVLGADGGYVIAPAHEMQDDIPPENIVAWVETIKGLAESAEGCGRPSSLASLPGEETNG